jgi:hypothetical protein
LVQSISERCCSMRTDGWHRRCRTTIVYSLFTHAFLHSDLR